MNAAVTSIDLSGQVALITGSSRNIGRAMALEFARCGAWVVVNAKTNVERNRVYRTSHPVCWWPGHERTC